MLEELEIIASICEAQTAKEPENKSAPSLAEPSGL